MSPGIQALARTLGDSHEVWLLAPEGERSGQSHKITIEDPIRVQSWGERQFACSGSTADCVILGMLEALPVEPDVVISGINRGPNLGTDIMFSGTASGARQAAYMGKPGIAVSVNAHAEPLHYDRVAAFVHEHLEELIALWNPEVFININAPNVDAPLRLWEFTHPALRLYDDKVLQFRSPSNSDYYFLDGRPAETALEPGTDWHSVNEGRVSVGLVHIHPSGVMPKAGVHSGPVVEKD